MVGVHNAIAGTGEGTIRWSEDPHVPAPGPTNVCLRSAAGTSSIDFNFDPSADPNVTSYRIYRNAQPMATVSDTS